MRAIWKGAVAFGLVNVPVKVYAATGEHNVTLHQVHREDRRMAVANSPPAPHRQWLRILVRPDQ